MKRLTYEQTLDIIDKFMVTSGIRGFCTNICGSRCCTGCKDNNPLRCSEVEGRRLSCTIYMCKTLVIHVFTAQELKLFYKIQEVILKRVGKHMNLTEYPMPKSNYPSAIYSLPPGKKLYKEKFPGYIKSLDDIDCKKIQRIINRPIFPTLFRQKK